MHYGDIWCYGLSGKFVQFGRRKRAKLVNASGGPSKNLMASRAGYAMVSGNPSLVGDPPYNLELGGEGYP